MGQESVRMERTLELAAASKELLEEPLGILLSLDCPRRWDRQGNRGVFSCWSEGLPTAKVRPSPTLSLAAAITPCGES